MARSFFTLLSILFIISAAGHSTQNSTPLPSFLARHKTLSIAVYEQAPFAFRKDKNAPFQGISIDVWELIARKNHMTFRYIPVTREEGLKGISQSRYDLLLGHIPDFVPSGGLTFEYSVPIYTAGTGIAYVKESGFRVLYHYCISWNSVYVILALIGFIFLQAATFWVFEHKKNPAYKKSFWHSFGSGLWWSMGIVSTMCPTSEGSTRTLLGRFMTGFWVFLSLFVINVFIGSIVSELTVGKLSSHIQDVTDLKRLNNKILSVQGTFIQEFLIEHDIHSKTVPSLVEGLAALKNGDAKALLYDEPLLKYALLKNPIPNIRFMPTTCAMRYCSFIMPQHSPLLPVVNRDIIILLDKEMRRIIERYIGK